MLSSISSASWTWLRFCSCKLSLSSVFKGPAHSGVWLVCLQCTVVLILVLLWGNLWFFSSRASLYDVVWGHITKRTRHHWPQQQQGVCIGDNESNWCAFKKEDFLCVLVCSQPQHLCDSLILVQCLTENRAAELYGCCIQHPAIAKLTGFSGKITTPESWKSLTWVIEDSGQYK